MPDRQGKGRECQAEAAACVRAGKDRSDRKFIWLRPARPQGEQVSEESSGMGGQGPPVTCLANALRASYYLCLLLKIFNLNLILNRQPDKSNLSTFSQTTHLDLGKMSG